jgi:hypothetical protein
VPCEGGALQIVSATRYFAALIFCGVVHVACGWVEGEGGMCRARDKFYNVAAIPRDLLV